MKSLIFMALFIVASFFVLGCETTEPINYDLTGNWKSYTAFNDFDFDYVELELVQTDSIRGSWRSGYIITNNNK